MVELVDFAAKPAARTKQKDKTRNTVRQADYAVHINRSSTISFSIYEFGLSAPASVAIQTHNIQHTHAFAYTKWSSGYHKRSRCCSTI